MRNNNPESAARDIVWGGLTVVLIVVAVTVIVLFSAPSSDGFVQQATETPGDKAIDEETRAETSATVLNECCVVPEVAKEKEDFARKQMKEGKADILDRLSTFTVVLNENIGHLDLRGFNQARRAGESPVAAMNFLTSSNAIMIDLRKNGGGRPSMIQLRSSYFFDEPVHLNSPVHPVRGHHKTVLDCGRYQVVHIDVSAKTEG